MSNSTRTARALLIAAAISTPSWAETLYTNADIYTANPANLHAEAMIVDGAKITFVGSAAEAAKQLPADANTIDLGGKFVMPAMMDTHTHPGLVSLFGEATEEGAQVPEGLPNESKEALLSYLRDYAANHADDPLIMLGAWDVRLFAPQGPNKADLDAIFPTQPVILFDNSGHSYWVNSAMFKLLGVNQDTPNLSKNLSYFVRDADGEMTGWIKEFPLMPYLAGVLARPAEDIEARLGIYLNFLAEHGITTVQDAGNFDFNTAVYSALAKMDKEGKLPVRYEGSYHIFSPQQIAIAIDELHKLRNTYGSDNLTFNTIKIHLDGVTEVNTAAMIEPYANEPHNHGGILFDAPQLAELMVKLAKEGIHLHMHTVGDRGTRTALDAVEPAEQQYGGKLPNQITLAHLEMLKPKDMQRFKKHGVNANFTPHWLSGTAFHGGDIALGEERYKHSQQVKSMINAGANVTFSSDIVGMDAYRRSNPFWGIEIGVTRQEPNVADAKIFGLPSERASIQDMLQGYTLNNAKQMALDDQLGSLQAGKIADFIVLPKSPFDIDIKQVHNLKPDAVYMNGKQIFPIN